MIDFDYEGVQNNQMAFRERGTGTYFFLPTTPLGDVHLLEGDQVRFAGLGDYCEHTWSIRDRRRVAD